MRSLVNAGRDAQIIDFGQLQIIQILILLDLVVTPGELMRHLLLNDGWYRCVIVLEFCQVDLTSLHNQGVQVELLFKREDLVVAQTVMTVEAIIDI